MGQKTAGRNKEKHLAKEKKGWGHQETVEVEKKRLGKNIENSWDRKKALTLIAKITKNSWFWNKEKSWCGKKKTKIKHKKRTKRFRIEQKDVC